MRMPGKKIVLGKLGMKGEKEIPAGDMDATGDTNTAGNGDHGGMEMNRGDMVAGLMEMPRGDMDTRGYGGAVHWEIETPGGNEDAWVVGIPSEMQIPDEVEMQRKIEMPVRWDDAAAFSARDLMLWELGGE